MSGLDRDTSEGVGIDVFANKAVRVWRIVQRGMRERKGEGADDDGGRDVWKGKTVNKLVEVETTRTFEDEI